MSLSDYDDDRHPLSKSLNPLPLNILPYQLIEIAFPLHHGTIDDSKDNGGALVSYSVNTGIIATIVAFVVGIFGSESTR